VNALLTILLVSPALALGQVIDLRGQWKFHIDDKPEWADAKLDDSKWEQIFTPAAWEDEGFHGYDGFAWYRKKFEGRLLNANEIYYLGLGFIDDCDEVYVNGKLVGFSGSMPPRFKTAYNTERRYPVPNDVINFSGTNTIAIRVFDNTLAGGILDGRLGVYRSDKHKSMLVDLEGIWSFATSRQGSRPRESDWQRIMVPGAWDFQGYAKYDGYAWYRRSVTLPPNTPTETLVLMLGRIDDFDQVYLNGQLIGSTNDHRLFGDSQSYSKHRAYDIPQALIKRSGPNLIEVLVEDIGHMGGIYDGVIGIATKGNYLRYFKR
jgi:hypothetical protein